MAPFLKAFHSVCLAGLIATSGAFPTSAAPVERGSANPKYGTWGFDLSGMDRSIRPGDDFYHYASGNWIRQAVIPPDQTATGLFRDLDAGDAAVRDLLDKEKAARPGSVTSAGKAVAFYDAFMDEGKIDKRGSAPLVAELDRLRHDRTHSDMAATMGGSFGRLGASVFTIEIACDTSDPSRYAIYIGQGGLGLPDRDYYIDARFASQLTAYRNYAATLLRLAGWPNASVQADKVVALETQIARASWSHEQSRDAIKTNNPATVDEMVSAMPQFDWKRFLSSAQLGNASRVVLTTNTSIPQIARIFSSTPLETLKAWQAFRIADAGAPYLSKPFDDASFTFRKRVLGGQQVPAPRWRRGIGLLNEAMGSAVGELYVAQYLPPTAEAQALALVEDVRSALRSRIESLTWMDTATKAEALRKLANEEIQVGRPAKWVDYSNLSIKRDDLFADVEADRAFQWKRQVEQSHGPWNKSDWRFWPQYSTSYSENKQLIITAAMLQAPFFDPAADPAINFGGIGAVIGHELTHQFDDQGRYEDSNGRLRDWWTAADSAHFRVQASRLSAQYSAIEPLPGLHIKGAVTLGENIADLGGLSIALAAYRLSLGTAAPPVLDGFTGDQRVFLGWAQGWREKRRDDSLRQQVTSDVHSPAIARVNGVVRNIGGWYAAYGVAPGQGLYLPPATRVSVW
jgi:putative endopeptidase